jgi:hypothetical protein
MYKNDVAIIKDHVFTKGSDGLVDVIEFVLCTIQSGLSTVKNQRVDILLNGIHSKYLWGNKREGLCYSTKNKDFLWNRLQYLLEKGAKDPEVCTDAILLLMRVPNLGMVKAAFVCQCIGFDTACLDTHNLVRLGLTYKDVSVNKKASPKLKRSKVLQYVKKTQVLGSGFWWDTWCEYVAGNTANRKLTTGEAVSNFHVECIKL